MQAAVQQAAAQAVAQAAAQASDAASNEAASLTALSLALPPPSPSAGGFRSGDRVAVLWDMGTLSGTGVWHYGRIIETKSELAGRSVRQMYRVHYEDDSKSWNGDGVGASGKSDLLMCYAWQTPLINHLTTRARPVPPAQQPAATSRGSLQAVAVAEPTALPAMATATVVGSSRVLTPAQQGAPRRTPPVFVRAPPGDSVGSQLPTALNRQQLALRQYIEMRREAAGKMASKPWKMTLRRAHLCQDVLAVFAQARNVSCRRAPRACARGELDTRVDLRCDGGQLISSRHPPDRSPTEPHPSDTAQPTLATR